MVDMMSFFIDVVVDHDPSAVAASKLIRMLYWLETQVCDGGAFVLPLKPK